MYSQNQCKSSREDAIRVFQEHGEYQAPPCNSCEYFSSCKTDKKACHAYYCYVNISERKIIPIRSRRILSLCKQPASSQSLHSYLTTLKKAQADIKTSVFINKQTHNMFIATGVHRGFTKFSTNSDFVLAGYFGPEFSLQEIADYIDTIIDSLTIKPVAL